YSSSFLSTDTPPPDIYPLSLHDALPISWTSRAPRERHGLALVPRRPDVRRDLEEGWPELQHDVLVIGEQDPARVLRVCRAVDDRLHRLAARSALACEGDRAQRDAPHAKEVAERELARIACFDVDDPG